MKYSSILFITLLIMTLSKHTHGQFVETPEQACQYELDFYVSSVPEYIPTCKCVANTTDGSYKLECVDGCPRCNQDDSVCGVDTTTQFLDSNGIVRQYQTCFQFQSGNYTGSTLCYEDVLSEYETNQCVMNVNGVACQSCEYQERACGVQAFFGLYMMANCTNVPEIGYVVDDCTHTDTDGIVSSFFSANHHVGGTCQSTTTSGGGGSTTQNGTFVDNGGGMTGQGNSTGDVCTDQAFYLEEGFPEYERTCTCVDNPDDGTTTLACQDGCESCDRNIGVCGLLSFNDVFSSDNYYASQYTSCIEYTKGPYQGNIVCFEGQVDDAEFAYRSTWFLGAGDCRLSVNGVDCTSCVVQDKACDGFSGMGKMLYADCTNNNIGRIVDECDDSSFHELLSFIYHDVSEAGECNLNLEDSGSYTFTPIKPGDGHSSNNGKPSKDGTNETTLSDIEQYRPSRVRGTSSASQVPMTALVMVVMVTTMVLTGCMM